MPSPLARDPVVVLVPEAATIDPAIAYYADYSQSRDELARAFATLGRAWQWQPVSTRTMDATLDALVADSRARGTPLPPVINLCDGDATNDVPGVEVIDALVARGFRFTGADAHFYRLTTSKVTMKAAFDAARVPTAPWVAVADVMRFDAAHADAVLATTGTPAIVKPAVSAGSMGVTTASVVHDVAALIAQVRVLADGYHGWDLTAGGAVVERFVAGREFTVLLVGDGADARALPPVERVFHTALPPTEQFLSYDRLWEVYERESAMPDGGWLWEYAPLRDALAADVESVSRAAYASVGGRGYGRVDVRRDAATGALVVLEVNAQCALSEDDAYTSVGAILRFADMSFATLIDTLLVAAERA